MTSDDVGKSYWARFRKALVEHLESTTSEVLHTAWHSETNRTNFYRNDLLPRVATELGLELETELCRVDFAMSTVSKSGLKVPVVFIESENDIRGITSEVRKLCVVSAPLKVLLTCCEWDDTPGVWPHGGYRERLQPEWQMFVREHTQVWSQPSVFGVVIGEWQPSDVLRFYGFSFDSGGALYDPETTLFARPMLPSS